jgi:hypothetical protein
MGYAIDMSGERAYLYKLLLEILEQRVAMRAYERYESRDNAPGGALDDWLKAEGKFSALHLGTALPQRKSIFSDDAHASRDLRVVFWMQA